MNASFSFSFFFILFYFVECFFLNSCRLFPVNKTGSWKGIFCWNCLEVFSSPVEQGPFSRQVSFIFQDQKLSLSQCVYGVLLTVWFSVVVLSFPRLKFDFFFFFLVVQWEGGTNKQKVRWQGLRGGTVFQIGVPLCASGMPSSSF